MKGDIGIFLDNGVFDLHIKDGDLETDMGLETAVIISIFSDRRVNDEELPQGARSKKGWWGDMFPEIDQDQIGSRLWTLDRSKTTQETLRLYKDYTKEALQWLIEDGVAQTVTVDAEYNPEKKLFLDVHIVKPDGRESRFNINWDKQEIRRG